MRNRIVGAVLALTLGAFGAQDFYLNKQKNLLPLKWVLSLLGLAIVPVIMGIIDFFKLLNMNQEEFDSLYNGGFCSDVPTLLNWLVQNSGNQSNN